MEQGLRETNRKERKELEKYSEIRFLQSLVSKLFTLKFTPIILKDVLKRV